MRTQDDDASQRSESESGTSLKASSKRAGKKGPRPRKSSKRAKAAPSSSISESQEEDSELDGKDEEAEQQSDASNDDEDSALNEAVCNMSSDATLPGYFMQYIAIKTKAGALSKSCFDTWRQDVGRKRLETRSR